MGSVSLVLKVSGHARILTLLHPRARPPEYPSKTSLRYIATFEIRMDLDTDMDVQARPFDRHQNRKSRSTSMLSPGQDSRDFRCDTLNASINA